MMCVSSDELVTAGTLTHPHIENMCADVNGFAFITFIMFKKKKSKSLTHLTVSYLFVLLGHNRKYPADLNVKFPDTTALVGQNITLECFALGK